MFMIARRQPPVKQNPQSFLHCRKIAENRRKTQKRCNLNLQTGCGFTPSVCSLWSQPHSPFCRYATSSPGRGKSALKGTAELPQSKPDGFASSLWEGAFGMAGRFAAQVQSGLPGVHLPSAPFDRSHLPQGDGFSSGGKVSGFARGSLPEGAGAAQAATEGVFPLKKYAKNSAFRRVL